MPHSGNGSGVYNNLPAMAIALSKAGYGRDSIGQIFKDGVLVPFPEQQTTGITPYALAKQVGAGGARTQSLPLTRLV